MQALYRYLSLEFGLGRHNNIYDEPREVLRSIPGVELVEMADFAENSLCCGGGGRFWMETKKGERFADLWIGSFYLPNGNS